MSNSAECSPKARIVTALLRDGNRILLCHRSPRRRWYPDVWDLPGGHVEPGELPGAALARELREEHGIDVAAPSGPPLQEVHAEGQFPHGVSLPVSRPSEYTDQHGAEESSVGPQRGPVDHHAKRLLRTKGTLTVGLTEQATPGSSTPVPTS